MAGNSPYAAVQNFRAPIQDAISCFASAKVRTAASVTPSPAIHALDLGGVEPLALRSDAGLRLETQIKYEIVAAEGDAGPWRVHTIAYIFEIYQADAIRPLFAWHWHPLRTPLIQYPHLHLPDHPAIDEIGRKGMNLPKALSKLHLPTGRVCIEQVLQFAMNELGVEPLPEKTDGCREVLIKGQKIHEAWRTWGGRGDYQVPPDENRTA